MDKKVAENLHKRFHERVEENHNQKFRSTYVQIMDLDTHHHRRVLSSRNLNETVTNKTEIAEEPVKVTDP